MVHTEGFTDFIERNPLYRAALPIVLNNTSGNRFLIGGIVYRTLAHLNYGCKLPVVDLDWMAESVNPSLSLPPAWSAHLNSFGNYKLSRGVDEVDLVPLENVFSIKARGLPSTIDNYLSGVPLTIQSIAYDLQRKTIIGEVGLRALEEKIVGVHNVEFAHHRCASLGISLRQMIEQKASELGFSPVFDIS